MILLNYLIGLPLMLLCLLIQAATAFWSVRHYVRQAERPGAGSGFFATTRPLMSCMIIMTIGNFVQILLWALTFLVINEFSEFHVAIYHSMVNFGSLGYGDIVMSKPWRMLGAMEAINGVLMLGMTSAALMAILGELIKNQKRALGLGDS